MSLHTSMTPGAERSLDRAAQLAVALGASRIETSHMLWALWLEEGNAAALLSALGVQRDQIALEAPEDLQNVVVRTESVAAEIVYEARQFIRRFDSQGGELTSEHLLLALASTDTETLSGLGVTEAAIADLILPQEDMSSLPVGPEFQLKGPGSAAVDCQADDQNSGTEVQDSALSLQNSEFSVYRTIDAASNRAREGLRVVEDFVRFTLSDRFLNEELKACRHKLAEALQHLDPEALVRCRDTRGDMGTSVSTPTEHSRQSMESVVIANLKRVQEALRTLEEFAKLVPNTSSMSRIIEQIRYRSYTVEKAVRTTIRSNQTFAGRSLYLLLTESICQNPWQDVVTDALAAGVDIIQLREKSLPDSEVVRRGKWLKQQTAAAGAMFIMNDRPDLAVAASADGVHVGQEETSVANARQILGPGACIGVSTHSLQQAREAVLNGADYLGVGPVFPSKTKSFKEFAGTGCVTQVSEHTSLPWFAIGGIQPQTISDVVSAGAKRIAVSGSICGTSNVNAAVKAMAEALIR